MELTAEQPEMIKRAAKRRASGDNQLHETPVKSPYFQTQSQPNDPPLPEGHQTTSASLGPDPNQAQVMQSSSLRLVPSFFQQPCIQLAKQLLGQVLVRVIGDQRLTGKIVETEAYVGAEDTACHTYKGKQTASNKSMFLAPGHAYVYMTYGMYHCINVTSQGEGQAVLLRGLAPVEGKEIMTDLRKKASKKSDREFKTKDLCNGPGKLCLSLDIDRKLDSTDLTHTDSCMWLEKGDRVFDRDIVSCPRIGIDSATKEWVEKPLRFYVNGNVCVSKRNKARENEMKNS